MTPNTIIIIFLDVAMLALIAFSMAGRLTSVPGPATMIADATQPAANTQ
jgi:hypothetical protein